MDVDILDPHLLHAEAFIHMVVPMIVILIEDGLPVVVGEVVNGDDVVGVIFLFFSTSLFLFPLLSVLNPLSESLSSCSVVASHEFCVYSV